MLILIPTDCVHTPHQRSFFLQQTETATEIYNRVKVQRLSDWELMDSWYLYNTTSTLNVQGTSWKRWQKHCKCQRRWMPTVEWVFLGTSGQPSPMVPMLPIYSKDLVFFFFCFACRLDPYMSLLESSLSSRFSGFVNYRLVFFALCLKATYEWVHVIFVFLGLVYLTQFDLF